MITDHPNLNPHQWKRLMSRCQERLRTLARILLSWSETPGAWYIFLPIMPFLYSLNFLPFFFFLPGFSPLAWWGCSS